MSCLTRNLFSRLLCLNKTQKALINKPLEYFTFPRFDRSVSSKTYKQANGQRVGRKLIIASFATVSLGTIGYITYRANKLPVLETVTASESPRTRFNFIADIVDNAAPAVVFIQRNAVFYNQVVPESTGSGFIIREDGLILTNAHVVGNKVEVNVQLYDGTKYKGEVQAVDRVSDLATVKINAKNLPVLKLGNSASLRAGEWVVAMGNPLNLSNTVTHGIVSSPQRRSGELGMHGKNISYIQTDATINFGNSGGPLVNLDGEAVGINTMKVTDGVSFAIPSDYAKHFIEKASKVEQRRSNIFSPSSSSPSIIQPNQKYMGVKMLTLTPEIVSELRNKIFADMPNVKEGVLIVGVYLDSPAHRAGLHPGDVVTKINGKDIVSVREVYNVIDNNTKCILHVQRGAKEFDINLSFQNE